MHLGNETYSPLYRVALIEGLVLLIKVVNIIVEFSGIVTFW